MEYFKYLNGYYKILIKNVCFHVSLVILQVLFKNSKCLGQIVKFQYLSGYY